MITKNKHYVVVLGTRPNFIKAAAFFHEAKNHPEYQFTIVHTGQHFDPNMSKVFFEELNIPTPDIHLDIKGKFHTEKIGKMFNALSRVYKGYNFDGCIVFGDVNSTLAGALAAAKNSCPVVHIEAGLRSHDRRMPEEINRVTVDHLSEKLFTTEPSGNENLLLEGIEPSKIFYVGNIMIESLEIFWDKIKDCQILEQLSLAPKQYAVLTFHRQENTDNIFYLEKILSIINKVNEKIPVVFPMHPGTKAAIEKYNLNKYLDNIKIINPLGYFAFIKLVSESKGIITDSGGIQEETTHLGIPCATLRDNTERPITIESGSNKLFPIELDQAEVMIEHLNRTDFKTKNIPLWDSGVSKRIFEHL
ncbi:MAG: UDP-N-acetylglucosamine 2-epimerase (non-hydrolyzing) [Patescibacteria group bacterium]